VKTSDEDKGSIVEKHNFFSFPKWKGQYINQNNLVVQNGFEHIYITIYYIS
jgi:hypothetical protein